jgi:hypothetical protein
MGARVHARARKLRGVLFVALITLLGGLVVSFVLFVVEGEIFYILVSRSFGVGSVAVKKEKCDTKKEL